MGTPVTPSHPRAAAASAAVVLALAASCGRTVPYDVLSAIAAEPCPTGAVLGRVCAPDLQTWVNGAAVSVEATDCHGAPVQVATVTAVDGSFALEAVPAGRWTVHASVGAFTQDTEVTLAAGERHQLPDRGLCVAQHEVNIAVVTGTGDKIEHLLTSLGLHFTTFEGTHSTWPTSGQRFLLDLQTMQHFDLIFVDCAAASAGGYHVDFGAGAQTMQRNLKAFVDGGGSLYASDWALTFAEYAAPGGFDFLTGDDQGVGVPLDTTRLMGFAPQSVTAQVADPGLRDFLGKPQVDINFPKQGSAVSVHWGLMASAAGATVLVSADGVQTCGDSSCVFPGPSRDAVPLAVQLKRTGATVRGGTVVYTAFHNIAQAGDDVAQMLKYLVLHL